MTCLLCRGLISFKDRSQTRFLDHMKQEHNVRYDFNILLVATLWSEAEKTDIVETNRGKFEPQNVGSKSENVERCLTIIDEENSSTEPLIECKFCDSKVTSRLELKNHMMNDHAAKPNDQVEAKTVIPVVRESIEGVLKCKVCGKYIKQSIMAEHKAKHTESEKQINDNIEVKSKNKVEEVSKTKASERVAVETKSSNIKPTVSKPEPPMLANTKPIGNYSEKEPPRSGKRKTLADKDWDEEDNDDSDDEDFDPTTTMEKVESPKQQSCKYYSQKFGRFCSKKFSSKVRLLSHMRVSHEMKPPGQ